MGTQPPHVRLVLHADEGFLGGDLAPVDVQRPGGGHRRVVRSQDEIAGPSQQCVNLVEVAGEQEIATSPAR